MCTDSSSPHNPQVAPGVKILALDVFRLSYAFESDLLAAVDWVLQNKDAYNICVINLRYLLWQDWQMIRNRDQACMHT
jgi:hypothetical protein